MLVLSHQPFSQIQSGFLFLFCFPVQSIANTPASCCNKVSICLHLHEVVYRFVRHGNRNKSCVNIFKSCKMCIFEVCEKKICDVGPYVCVATELQSPLDWAWQQCDFSPWCSCLYTVIVTSLIIIITGQASPYTHLKRSAKRHWRVYRFISNRSFLKKHKVHDSQRQPLA